MNQKIVTKLAGISVALLAVTCGLAADGLAADEAKSPVQVTRAYVGVTPHPQTEKFSNDRLRLADSGYLSIALGEGCDAAPVHEGIGLVERRLKQLGAAGIKTSADTLSADLSVERVLPEQLFNILGAGSGIANFQLDSLHAKQAYALQVVPINGRGRVRLRATDALGVYYGLVSLCQLIDIEEARKIIVPHGEIFDWPEITRRMSKISGSLNEPDTVARFSSWLGPMKISQIALQFHGDNSKNPDANFNRNVQAQCGANRKTGVLQSIIYFCPFRATKSGAGRFNFSREADRQAYAALLGSFVAQGADGIEVDYNDWPDKGDEAIEDVINLAHSVVTAQNPNTQILYCAPLSGKSTYRGNATPEMRRILSLVPENVWPLWTGMESLMTVPLTASQVERWANAAGRRPFLWINRASPLVPETFSRPADTMPELRVFCGERVPKELNRLFEGVHLNCGISRGKLTDECFSENAMAYLVTASDFLWNPVAWDNAESARRAIRFVKIMAPLMPNELATQQ